VRGVERKKERGMDKECLRERERDEWGEREERRVDRGK
jgi:hypothetical protein